MRGRRGLGGQPGVGSRLRRLRRYGGIGETGARSLLGQGSAGRGARARSMAQEPEEERTSEASWKHHCKPTLLSAEYLQLNSADDHTLPQRVEQAARGHRLTLRFSWSYTAKMRSLSWVGLTAALALAMLGCDSTERDFSTGSGGGGSGNGGAAGSGGEPASGSGGAGGSECPATHVCVPEVPAGWTGPVTHVLGSSTPECPAEYPVLEADLNADLTVPSSTCSCSCGSPLVTCPTVAHVGYSPVCPKDPQGANTLMNGECVQTGTTWGFQQSKPSASCGKPVLVEDIPMAGFTNKARICGGDGAGAGECSGTGQCAPKPAGEFEKVCVYKSGEEACPDGYPAQVLLHKGFSDTRACQACSCTPQGAQCAGSITAYQTTTCTGASMAAIVKDTTSIDNPLCVPNNWVSVKYNSTSVNPGTCEVSGGGLAGDVLPTDATTVCCAQ